MLFLCFYGSLLDGETGLVVLDVGIEAGHVFSRGGNLHTSIACKHLFFEPISQILLLVVVYHKRCKQGDTLSTAFTGSLHHGDGRVEGSRKHTLAHALGLEVTAVACDALHFHVLFLQKDVVSEF